MNMKVKTVALASLLAVIFGSSSLLAASETAASSTLPVVVTTTWLADHLKDPGLVVLHIGPLDSYKEGHIPGARIASLRKLMRVDEAGLRDEMPPSEEIARNLSELGINRESQVVTYFAKDDGMGFWAVARYLLTLEHVGMAGRVAYLDGGLPKWIAENRPISTEETAIAATSLTVKAVDDVLVNSQWLSARLGKPGITIVDGRPEAGYSGVAGEWARLGHIAGAVNIPFADLLAKEPPCLLKTAAELTDLFKKAGVKAGDTVVVYCGTGIWASFPYLAARYLGYQARLYDGSFQEWSANESLPVAGPEKSGDSDHKK
jgi:thiosulfate/3-mercaptopyruvate sulfurtransferase